MKESVVLPKILDTGDVVIGRNFGAAAFLDPVILPDGTKITGVKVIAGKGTSTRLRNADKLIAKFGGKKEN